LNPAVVKNVDVRVRTKDKEKAWNLGGTEGRGEKAINHSGD